MLFRSHETIFYVGDMSNGILTGLSSPFVTKCDYTADDILVKREKYKQLKRLADNAHSELGPFGEYDSF